MLHHSLKHKYAITKTAIKKINKQGIKINIIGKQEKLPPDIVQSLKLIEKKTKKNNSKNDLKKIYN